MLGVRKWPVLQGRPRTDIAKGMQTKDRQDLKGAVTSVRHRALDLLEDMERMGFAADPSLADAVAGMQSVVNALGASQAGRATPPPVSQDAAIVLALASTAIPFATSIQDEAARWLRVMRLHGQVGVTLQALGVPESPLETGSAAPPNETLERRPRDRDPVVEVTRLSRELARRRSADVTGTVDVLFALFAVYGKAFDRALYTRGTSRDELLECLAARADAEAGADVSAVATA
jgi:hypothetical protein